MTSIKKKYGDNMHRLQKKGQVFTVRTISLCELTDNWNCQKNKMVMIMSPEKKGDRF